MELGLSFWNMVHFLDAERLVFNFPHTNPVEQTHVVFQYTSLLLHGLSFSHRLVLVFFFSNFLADDDGTKGIGFGGSFVREEKQFPSYLCTYCDRQQVL